MGWKFSWISYGVHEIRCEVAVGTTSLGSIGGLRWRRSFLCLSRHARKEGVMGKGEQSAISWPSGRCDEWKEVKRRRCTAVSGCSKYHCQVNGWLLYRLNEGTMGRLIFGSVKEMMERVALHILLAWLCYTLFCLTGLNWIGINTVRLPFSLCPTQLRCCMLFGADYRSQQRRLLAAGVQPPTRFLTDWAIGISAVWLSAS